MEKIKHSWMGLLVLLGLGSVGLVIMLGLLKKDPKALSVLKLDKWAETSDVFAHKYEGFAGTHPWFTQGFGPAWQKATGQLITEKVMPGKEGWLFFWQETPRINLMEQVSGQTQLSPREIKSWRLFFDQKYAWCKERGIDYVLVLAPNKGSIYPEMLPDEIKSSPHQFLDELIRDLREHTELPWIDLRPTLKAAKKERQVFYHTDTHWNQWGAYNAYLALMRRLNDRAWRDTAAYRFQLDSVVYHEGDLARLALRPPQAVGFHYEVSPQPEIAYDVQRNFTPEFPAHGGYRYERAAAALPKAVLFHDSFSHDLHPFLGRHFQDLRCYWTFWDMGSQRALTEDPPALLIEQTLERRLAVGHQANEASWIQPYWEKRFDQLRQSWTYEGTSFSQLAGQLGLRPVETDQLWVVALEVEAEESGHLRIENQYRYEPEFAIQPGRQSLFVHLDPAKPVLFRSSSPGLKLLGARVAVY